MSLSVYPTRLFDIKKRRFTKEHHLIREYAILSHRWDEHELTFDQLSKHSFWRRKSNQKFKKFCEVALKKYGCRYVWMDSACINQSDAAELEVSIQSMFWWYQLAKVCIVYLADAFDSESFASSSWFTRGWTLQELLAPERLVFYYGDWSRVLSQESDIFRSSNLGISDIQESSGDANTPNPGQALRQCIAKAAGIEEKFLYSRYEPSPSNLETVFTWAQGRRTTREEDAAYCLVALLDVCLPPRDGEGRDGALDRLRHACREACNSPTVAPTADTGCPDSSRVTGAPLLFILLRNPSKSHFCEHHQALEGHPMIVHFLTTDTYQVSTNILFTSLPISDDIVRDLDFIEATSPDGLRRGYNTLWSVPYQTGSIKVPSTFIECGHCLKKAFCGDPSCECVRKAFEAAVYVGEHLKILSRNPYFCMDKDGYQIYTRDDMPAAAVRGRPDEDFLGGPIWCDRRHQRYRRYWLPFYQKLDGREPSIPSPSDRRIDSLGTVCRP